MSDRDWETLDHTQVDGTGTAGNIAKFSSTNVIADSIMAESGSTITVTGSLTTTQLLSSTGNFAVNTDKFTVNASSGDTVSKGDHSVQGGDLILGTDSIASNINSVGDVLNLNVDSNGGGASTKNITLQTTGTTRLKVTPAIVTIKSAQDSSFDEGIGVIRSNSSQTGYI